MLGKKRRNVSLSSNSDANPFQNKKVGPQFSFGGQASSVAADLKLGVAPSLDRRKAARQHVRALNTEFASWVQSQLQDHPDELWEDGVRDYLTHAADVLEKYTDVVNWLETNTNSEGCVSTPATDINNGPEIVSQETSVPVKSVSGLSGNLFGLTSSSGSGASPTSNNGTTSGSTPSWSFGLSANSQALSQSSSVGLATSWNTGGFSNSNTVSAQAVGSSLSPGFGMSSGNQTTSPVSASGFTSSTSPVSFSTSFTPSFSTSSSFTTSWAAGASANSQTTFLFGGNQTSAPSTIATEGADEDDEPEQPSSPSLKQSEEKGIVVVHETKCKLYVKPVKSAESVDKEPWKDKGVGQLFIKCEEGSSKGTKESKPRILVRNDVGKIMLNASLYAGIKTNLTKNAIMVILHTLDEKAGEDGSGKVAPHTFLIKTKNAEETNKLADAIREHAPAA